LQCSADVEVVVEVEVDVVVEVEVDVDVEVEVDVHVSHKAGHLARRSSRIVASVLLHPAGSFPHSAGSK